MNNKGMRDLAVMDEFSEQRSRLHRSDIEFIDTFDSSTAVVDSLYLNDAQWWQNASFALPFLVAVNIGESGIPSSDQISGEALESVGTQRSGAVAVCASLEEELAGLPAIFSSQDALAGLNSVGRPPPEYLGR